MVSARRSEVKPPGALIGGGGDGIWENRRAEGQKNTRAEGQKNRKAQGQKGTRAEGQEGQGEDKGRVWDGGVHQGGFCVSVLLALDFQSPGRFERQGSRWPRSRSAWARVLRSPEVRARLRAFHQIAVLGRHSHTPANRPDQ